MASDLLLWLREKLQILFWIHIATPLVNRAFRLQNHKYSYIPTRNRQCFFTLWTRHLNFLNGNVYIPSLGAVLLFVLRLEAGAGARVLLLSELHVG
jgi:hypothetical protein